jgi:hypothetical protein
LQNGVISINTTKNNLKNSENIAIINCKVKEEKQSRQPFLVAEPLLPYILSVVVLSR